VSPPLQLRFVMSATRRAALPEAVAEVAVVGRSNVGKSSLINALANRRDLARVSKTPGRTQLLNLYDVAGGQGSLVDLPGYGYAAVPGRTRATWPAMIEGYLLEREHLVLTLVLVDAEVGPTKLDVQTLEWFRGHGLAHAVVATKHDKVKASVRQRRKAELLAGCEEPVAAWTSAAKGTGIDELRLLLRSRLA